VALTDESFFPPLSAEPRKQECGGNASGGDPRADQRFARLADDEQR